ncbi:unnamed protein product, partial [Anisakis simplex]|uniref:Uncharacterized protein n=1 Tax=Anisakis simplex TaxID=6269 RepID=A0A0M3JI86_ANISI
MIRSGERNVAAETIQSEAMRRRRQTSSSTSDQNGAADEEDEWNEDVQQSKVTAAIAPSLQPAAEFGRSYDYVP